MRIFFIGSFCAFFVLLTPYGKVSAQQYSGEIGQYVGENAKQFLLPLADGLIADLNGSVFITSRAEGFHAGVHMVGMGAIVTEDLKTFKPLPFSTSVDFTYGGEPFVGDLDINS